MCNTTAIIFGSTKLNPDDILGARILEVGARNWNGSLREIIQKWAPSEYIGADIVSGEGTDVVCSAEKLLEAFGPDSFDIIISTELLEHILDWKIVVSNLKKLCKPGGLILITTRSFGYKYHPFPNDYWRFEIEDMRKIFSDCEILNLEEDAIEPGVCILVRIPESFSECGLSTIKLYSIIHDKVVLEPDIRTADIKLNHFHKKERIKNFLRKVFYYLYK